MRSVLAPAVVVASLLLAGVACAGDPAAAREQLKQGYALKEAGRYEEAIPHLLESERLDPQPKTLINLAECQGKTGLLVEAEENLVAARDMATRPDQAVLRDIAVKRLAALEPRLPRLRISTATDAGALHLEVARDGTALGTVSLGTPLPANPGKHVVVVRAQGRAERSFEVTLAEGEQMDLVVSAGEPLASPAAPPAVSFGAPSPAPVGPTDVPAAHGETAAPARPGARRTLALVTGGAGVAALATGTVFALVSMYEYSQSDDGCDAQNRCHPDAYVARQHSLQHGDFATGFMVAGAALVGGGIVLWLTAPVDRSPDAARVALAPAATPSGASLTLEGTW